MLDATVAPARTHERKNVRPSHGRGCRRDELAVAGRGDGHPAVGSRAVTASCEGQALWGQGVMLHESGPVVCMFVVVVVVSFAAMVSVLFQPAGLPWWVKSTDAGVQGWCLQPAVCKRAEQGVAASPVCRERVRSPPHSSVRTANLCVAVRFWGPELSGCGVQGSGQIRCEPDANGLFPGTHADNWKTARVCCEVHQG